MGTHPSKVQGKKNASKHNPKKKQKQTINKNQLKTLCKEDSRLRNTIRNNQEDLDKRAVIWHKSVIEVHRAGRNFICTPLGLNPGPF
jgi:hypothetical protein